MGPDAQPASRALRLPQLERPETGSDSAVSALWVVLWSLGGGEGVNSGAAGWPNLVTGLHACVQTIHPFTDQGRVFLAPVPTPGQS